MTIITISRQYGSGGDEIASRICNLLNYQMFDKRLITQAALDAGLSEQEAIDYSEENYKIRSFLDRLFSRQPVVKHTGTAEPATLSEEAALGLVQNSIRSACKAGKLVIVGRGGQMILHECPGVLHLRVIAPMENRIQTLKGQYKQSHQDYFADIGSRRGAQDYIMERDAISADYIKRLYNADWDEPALYHLIINTAKMSIEMAAQSVAWMATHWQERAVAGIETPE